jgi:hypothetical protein
MLAIGTCVLTVDHSGNANCLPATQATSSVVLQTVVVTPSAPIPTLSGTELVGLILLVIAAPVTVRRRLGS